MSYIGDVPANWEELFAQHSIATGELLDRQRELVELMGKLREPASMEAVALTAQNSVYESSVVPGTLSVGLINPQPAAGLTMALGVLGSAVAADAVQVAPGKLVVLPIAVGVVEVAATTAIGAGATVYGFLLRFKQVQPAYYGS